MRYFMKVVLVLAAVLAGFGIGYLVGRPLLTAILMLMAREPSTNVELYNSFNNNFIVFLGSLVIGAFLAALLGNFTEKMLNRYGVRALGLRAGETSLVRVRLAVTLVETPEEGEEAPQGVRTQIFEGLAAVAGLRLFFSGDTDMPLVLRDSVHVGRTIALRRVPAGPYDTSRDAFAPIIITVSQRRSVIHSFECTAPGRYWKPEGKDSAFCRFALSYVGVEDELDAALIFEGAPEDMYEIFCR